MIELIVINLCYKNIPSLTLTTAFKNSLYSIKVSKPYGIENKHISKKYKKAEICLKVQYLSIEQYMNK